MRRAAVDGTEMRNKNEITSRFYHLIPICVYVFIHSF